MGLDRSGLCNFKMVQLKAFFFFLQSICKFVPLVDCGSKVVNIFHSLTLMSKSGEGVLMLIHCHAQQARHPKHKKTKSQQTICVYDRLQQESMKWSWC